MNASTKHGLTAVDLFCGCGGISTGLRSAGFKVLAGVDLNRHYISSFRANFPEAHTLELDLTTVAPAEFMRKIGVESGELDLIAGGPPCQGFSKNVPRKYRFLEDSRNLLIKTFLDYCEALQPRMVLMENVAEMKNGFDQAYTNELVERLEEEGYTVTHAVLNAADYGVPQRRRRAFFFANRFGVRFAAPPATHSQPVDSIQGSLFASASHVSVWDAIGDLPSLAHGEKCDPAPYTCEPFSDFQRLVRNGENSVHNHVARFLQPTQFARLAALRPGQGHKDLPKELQVGGGYSGAYGRLTKDMVAPTITRWVFHPGSGRWGHPVDVRVISIREVARIQSFPDSFKFVGSYTQQAGQLGNAVPPLLIQRLAESMLAQLPSDASKGARNASTLNLAASSGAMKSTL
jgi:DNA (cytosine-5)-methyltransferase 1